MADEQVHDDDAGRERLADYLGGEMTDEAREEFEAGLAGDEALAREVAALRRALGAMESLSSAGGAPSGSGARPGARRSSLFARPAIRYAAAIALAFGLGYLLGGAGPGAPVPGPGPGPDVPSRPVALEEPTSLDRFGEAWEARAGERGLGRSLLALAKAVREEKLKADS